MKPAPTRLSSTLAARFAIGIVSLALVILAKTPLSAQQAPSDAHRKALQKVLPSYPEMAKSIKLSGTVRVAVTVAPNGKVMSATVLGGHPLLAAVAVDAARQFRFEASPQQTEEVVTFTFQP